MKKIRRAVFCFVVLRAYITPINFARIRFGLHQWMIYLRQSKKRAGLSTIGAETREWIAEWVLADLMTQPMDFDTILHILGGDEFYERNKRDVARLQRETGRNIIEIWDTDPIFMRYPHLKTFGRNKEFEKFWNKVKTR